MFSIQGWCDRLLLYDCWCKFSWHVDIEGWGCTPGMMCSLWANRGKLCHRNHQNIISSFRLHTSFCIEIETMRWSNLTLQHSMQIIRYHDEPHELPTSFSYRTRTQNWFRIHLHILVLLFNFLCPPCTLLATSDKIPLIANANPTHTWPGTEWPLKTILNTKNIFLVVVTVLQTKGSHRAQYKKWRTAQ